ncbi:MAG: GNAT family N-acetyltransferase [Cyclobacteriaceae bacterium]
MKITALTKSEMIRQIKEILLIDQAIVGERWSKENFLFDMPEKWGLSLQILANNLIVGFLVASYKNNSIHIHRLAVGKEFQKQNIGKQLVDEIQATAKRRNIKLITLKVLSTNTDAIRFYERLGFVLKDRENLNQWMQFRLN